ncbi:hypothetical protein R6Q59_032536 [Mikania micrantha]
MNIQSEHDKSLGAFQMSTNTSRVVHQHQGYPVNNQWYGSSLWGGGHNFPQSTSSLNQQPARCTPGHGNGITGWSNKENYRYPKYPNELIFCHNPVTMTLGCKHSEATNFSTENEFKF